MAITRIIQCDRKGCEVRGSRFGGLLPLDEPFWLTLTKRTDGYRSDATHDYHFCSLVCLSQWAVQQIELDRWIAEDALEKATAKRDAVASIVAKPAGENKDGAA